MTEEQLIKDSDIAIIGMSCRAPGAATIDEFWQNIRDGIESISFFSDEEVMAAGIESATLEHPNYVKAGGVLSNIDLFDADFFDFSPREAQLTDPQHRIFLECAWESLENAGYALQDNDDIIGVYAGLSMNTYLLNNLYPNRDALADTSSIMIGNDKDFLPTRVSYKLNLRGPSINVQTACSTSLVAVHLACQSLLNGECDMSLAGGVSITCPQKTGYLYQEGSISSPDGHCRAFDARAKGTVGGNGVGVVVLKILEQALADGDPIHGVIKGSAVNNDGSLKVGYTAPGVEGQAAVISEARAVADVDAETIGYIEAHGTGTTLGDPIEIAALTKAFQETTQKKGFCAIGSLKTNIGHTDAAAGVLGLIKTVLALKHGLLPPSLHFENPNPQIDFENSPFHVNTRLSEWKTNGAPRRAGVSSFGIGGTNAHVIIEQAPVLKSSAPQRPWQLLALSAKTPLALDRAAANLAEYLRQHPHVNLADVAYTLHCGRQEFKHRRILICRDTQEAVTILSSPDPERTSSTLVNPHPDKAAEQMALSSLGQPQDNPSDTKFLLNTLGRLWRAGGSVDWAKVYANEHRHRLPLPTYPFERQRYWIDSPGGHQPAHAKSLVPPPQEDEPIERHSRSNSQKPYVAPRNQLEQTIADIWSKSLGIDQISIHDLFFDLGGDSLLAVQVIAQLTSRLNIDLDAHSLLNNETIIALAKFIEEIDPTASPHPLQKTLPSCLVPIQAGDSLTPPLFLMHPVGGHVYFYREMAKSLGAKQPVYGLQAQGADGKTAPLTRVEEMATQYINAVRILQPDGPYFLGGSSFGGTLAFEMAQQLMALGRKVAFLAMMDTPGPGHMPAELKDDAEILAYMLELGQNISVSAAHLRTLSLDEQLDYCIGQLKLIHKDVPDVDLTEFRTILNLFKINSKAMVDYIPSIYPGKIVFFRARERDAFLPHNPELAWIDLALKGTEVHIVPGNHISMNEQPQVQIIAKQLKICLDQASA